MISLQRFNQIVILLRVFVLYNSCMGSIFHPCLLQIYALFTAFMILFTAGPTACRRFRVSSRATRHTGGPGLKNLEEERDGGVRNTVVQSSVCILWRLTAILNGDRLVDAVRFFALVFQETDLDT